MDDNKDSKNLTKQELIGTCQFSLHSVVTSRDQTLKLNLQHPERQNNGKILICAEEKR